jgi:RNA polymerase sigma factor for flagellar operon FliA
MADPAQDLEQTFLASLPLVDRIVAIQARRHGFAAADAEEFGAWARARLMADDYAVFRKFGGRSSLQTYLVTVLVNLLRDFRNSRWGRWRPSAAARRLGPTAVRLEELVVRDGMPFREATEVLRSGGVVLGDRDLARMAAALPARSYSGEVGLDVAAELPDAGAVAGALAVERETAHAVERTLRDLVAALPAEDALVLRMRFWDDVSVADIARALGLDQKALYRRIERLQARLRESLAARGIDRAAAVDVLSGDFT